MPNLTYRKHGHKAAGKENPPVVSKSSKRIIAPKKHVPQTPRTKILCRRQKMFRKLKTLNMSMIQSQNRSRTSPTRLIHFISLSYSEIQSSLALLIFSSTKNLTIVSLRHTTFGSSMTQPRKANSCLTMCQAQQRSWQKVYVFATISRSLSKTITAGKRLNEELNDTCSPTRRTFSSSWL